MFSDATFPSVNTGHLDRHIPRKPLPTGLG
jgi:hypothetical protein